MGQFDWFPWRRLSEPTAIGIGRPDGTFDAPLIDGWQDLDSDVAARMYRNDMQLLFDFGAGSAIRGIKGTMANFARSGSAGWTWKRRASAGAAHLILQPIQQELYNLLALAVQGHFEKAYRRWLQNSLQFVDGSDITESDILKAQWTNPTAPRRDLGEIMARIRGVHLKDTIEGPYLIELALVGNVIRHGEGPSALLAYEKFPERFAPVIEINGNPAYGELDELPERLLITEERLATYAQAAYQFWHRVQLAFTGEY